MSNIQFTKLDTTQLIELWKYFAATGGTDKDRMVTIVTWIFGFSIAILSFIAVNLIDYSCFKVIDPPFKTSALSFLGLIVTLYGLRIILLYAGYTNWNWSKADYLALLLNEKFDIKELLPPDKNYDEIHNPISASEKWPKYSNLYPIFRLFLIMALFLLSLQIFTLVLSLIRFFSNLS